MTPKIAGAAGFIYGTISGGTTWHSSAAESFLAVSSLQLPATSLFILKESLS